MAKTPDPVDVHVGRTIRARRKHLGVSQESLANACDLTFQQIQKYEKATNRVSASMLVKIAEHLDCSPASLLPASDLPPAGDEHVDALRVAGMPQGTELIRAFLAMDSERRRGLLTVAKAMLPTTPIARSADDIDADQASLFEDAPRASVFGVALAQDQGRRHVA